MKRNILVITRWFPNIMEPAKCVFTKNIIDAQAASNKYSYTVISPVPYFPNLKLKCLRKYSKFNKIPFIEKTMNYIIYRPRYFKLPFSFWTRIEPYFYFFMTLKIIKQEKIGFDLIHAHGIYPDGAVAVRMGKYFNKKVVLHMHESDLFDYVSSNGYKEILESVDALIPVSYYQKEEIGKINGKLSSKCSVVYNGVKFGRRSNAPHNLDESKTKIKIIFIGHLIYRKGLDILLKVIKSIKDIEVGLDVVGVGEELGEYIAMCREYQIADRVKFLGELDNSILLDKLGGYDFLVLPTRDESFGVVLIEALSCGVPVVSTKVGPIPEIVSSDDFGILVEPDNPEDLTMGIRKAIDKKWNREKIMESAKKYSIENTATEIETVYKNILEY